VQKAKTMVSAAAAHEDALRRLNRAPSIMIGRLRPSGDPIRLTEDIALMHAIVLGATGSGKTHFLIGLLLDQLRRALSHRAPGEQELAFETEMLDVKGETAALLRLYIVA
jgi:DNA helicase HerA-like ATPase